MFSNIRYDDFGIDEFQRVGLIMALEEEFDIEIPDEKTENIITVQNLFDVIIFCLQDK